MKNLISFLLLLSVFSCEKNHHVIHVSATNIVTGEPYEGLKISVVATTPGVFESQYKNVYEGYLDANGEASFDLKMKNNKSYNLGIELPENTCYFNDLYFNLKHDQETQNVEVEFAPCGFLELKVNNVNCENANDSITFYRTWIDKNVVGTPNTQLGCFFYDGEFFDLPVGSYSYNWTVVRTSTGLQTFSDTFTITEGGYTTFEINY